MKQVSWAQARAVLACLGPLAILAVCRRLGALILAYRARARTALAFPGILALVLASPGLSNDGNGVLGSSQSKNGVSGQTNGDSGTGVEGLNSNTKTVGLLAGRERVSNGLAGVYGESSDAGVYGHVTSDTGTGVFGHNGGGGRGVAGLSDSNSGVYGQSTSGPGVSGISDSNSGVYGETSTDAQAGVFGVNKIGAGFGVHGEGDVGVDGKGIIGLRGEGAFGVFARATTYALWAQSSNLAGLFDGRVSISAPNTVALQVGGRVVMENDVQVIGQLIKSGGGFRIDHPLNPARQFITHSFVESSERKNLYDGIVKVNARGEATVKLPKWFESINGSFSYQLTSIGTPAPNLHVATKVTKGQFKIAGGTPRSEVSWQVTGVRKDPWAKANPLVVEESKPARQRGFYLHPALYREPQEKSIAGRFTRPLSKEANAVVTEMAKRRSASPGGLAKKTLEGRKELRRRRRENKT